MAIHPASQPYNWTFRQVVWATLVLVAVVFSFWLLYRFYQVVFILFIATVMGTVIRPAVAWLHRRGLPRMAGVILVYLLLLALLIGFGLLLFPLFAEQSLTIAATVPDYYHSLREWTINYPNQWLRRLGRFLPLTLSGQGTVQQTGQEMLDSAGLVLGYAASAAQVLFAVTAMLLLSFYWTLDGPRTIRSLLPLAPIDQRESMRELISAMEIKVSSYVAGQAVLCLIVGLMALVAYWFIGLPNVLVLAFIAGVMEAVPLIGPLLGAIPAALVGLSLGPGKLVWVIVVTVVIQQLENNFLVPRVMRATVGVNPFVSLLALFAFGSLLGVAGAIMAIPMAALISLLLDRFVFGPAAIEPAVSTGRDYPSRLRYEAQDLAQDLRRQARLKKGGADLRVMQTDYVLDEIEAIATDLDSLLVQIDRKEAP